MVHSLARRFVRLRRPHVPGPSLGNRSLQPDRLARSVPVASASGGTAIWPPLSRSGARSFGDRPLVTRHLQMTSNLPDLLQRRGRQDPSNAELPWAKRRELGQVRARAKRARHRQHVVAARRTPVVIRTSWSGWRVSGVATAAALHGTDPPMQSTSPRRRRMTS